MGFEGFGGGGGGVIPPGSITNVEIALNTILNSNMAVNSVKGHGAGATINIVAGSVQGQAPGGAATSDIKPLTLVGSGPGGPGTGDIAPGSIAAPELANGAVGVTAMSGAAMPHDNFLSNCGFIFAQLYDPTITNVIPNNAVGPDCWKSTRENADLTYDRINQNGTAIRAPYKARYTKQVGTGRILIYQGIEAKLSRGMRGTNAIFQCNFNSSIALSNLHVAILGYTGGVPDVLPNPLVTVWNGGAVPPTFDPNITVLFDFATGGMLPGVSYLWGVSTTLPATIDNFIVAVWADEQYGPGEYLDMWEPGMFVDFGFRAWSPLSFVEDVQRVERFIEASYAQDVAPGTMTPLGAMICIQNGASHQQDLRFRVRKPKVPVITLYSPNALNDSGNWYDGVGDIPVGNAITLGEAGTGIAVLGAGGTDGNILYGHYVVDASL
jgi:hypothetical protein